VVIRRQAYHLIGVKMTDVNNNINTQLNTTWVQETLDLCTAYGYRTTPVFSNGSTRPYAAGQDYKDIDDYTRCEHIGLVLDECVLLDYDGNKPGATIMSVDALADTIGEEFGMPPEVQVKKESRHWLYIKSTVTGSSCDGAWPYIDIKTNNQLMHLKIGKKLALVSKDDLEVCPDALLAKLGSSSGMGDDEDWSWSPSEVSRSDIVTMLSELDYNMPNSDWVNVGMALHDWHDIDGLELWEEWSADGDTYKEGECEKRWQSFNHTNGGISVGSLFHWSGGVVVADASDDSDSLAIKIRQYVHGLCGGAVTVNASIIKKIIMSTFWSSSKNRFFFLNNNSNLVAFPSPEVAPHWITAFGDACPGVLDLGDVDIMSVTEIRRLHDAVGHIVRAYIKYNSQRDSIDMEVDMFCGDVGRIDLKDERVTVVFPHKHYTESGYDEAVVIDFRAHFAEFEEFIDYLVAARFADDRKQAYLWLHCSSDWGKGLIMSALDELDASVSLSIKEIEGAFEGKPVGRSMIDFKRSIVLMVDEFKNVKSEVKQLQNKMTIAPKHQLSVSVPLFAKLFFSAEDVGSLASDSGIEDQFANRFSLIRRHGDITLRPLFKQVGKGAYFRSIKGYIAEQLNNKMAEYVALGAADAGEKGSVYLHSFQDKFGIDKEYGRFSAEIINIANDIREHMLTYEIGSIEVQDNGKNYIVRPSKIVSDWIHNNYDSSQVVSVAMKKSEIIKNIDLDKKGVRDVKIKGKVVKAIRIV